MDEQLHKQAVQEAAKKKFMGHEVLHAKYLPKFPDSIEREYAKITNQYMLLLRDSVAAEVPKLKEQIMRENGTYRTDGVSDFLSALSNTFQKATELFEKKDKGYGLRRKLEALANKARKLTIKEWRKAVQKTLGIDIMDDYYMGEFYKSIMDQWVEENISLIKTIPEDALSGMKDIVKTGFSSGKSATGIMKDIQGQYNISKSRGRLIARDQIGKLNASVTKAQQEDAGIEEYIWATCGDSRVRKCHKHLNGKKYRWDSPPEMYYVSKKKGVIYSGRRCHPGQDYQCRCIARPVFKRSTLNMPAGSGE